MSSKCTECDEPGCPGITVCPSCHIGEHGYDALTQIRDHGYCRECLRAWQFADDEPDEDWHEDG